jgi:hypothetical protein
VIDQEAAFIEGSDRYRRNTSPAHVGTPAHLTDTLFSLGWPM